jgi:FMN phosphatase YigB (HAD superfamily)
MEPAMFSHIITDDHFAKSNGDAYKAWLERYPGVDASDFLYVGDRPKTDYSVPRELGIVTILVNQKKVDPEIDSPQLPTLLDIKGLLL